MFCPQCEAEYPEASTVCADCDVALTSEPPAQRATPEAHLVRVYETGNPALIAVAKSLLEDAKIEFMTKGEPVQDLFGWGRLGTGFSCIVGPVEFFVREDEAETARQVLTAPMAPLATNGTPEDD
jgi:hypothetical protein